MATIDEVGQLRRMTATPEDDPVYTADLLGTYIDNLGTLEAAAAAVWAEKAAAASTLVDMAESGSSRSLSQLQKAALAMQNHFRPDEPATPTEGASFTVRAERV